MIADRDYYADKNGKLTDDPNQYASQVAVKGFHVDARILKRFGIIESPKARPATSRNKGSVQIYRAEDKEELASVADQPETDEPEAEEPKAAASTKAAAKEEGVNKKK